MKTARQVVRETYPRAKVTEDYSMSGSLRFCILSGRGTYQLSEWQATPEMAWSDALKRLREAVSRKAYQEWAKKDRQP